MEVLPGNNSLQEPWPLTADGAAGAASWEKEGSQKQATGVALAVLVPL